MFAVCKTKSTDLDVYNFCALGRFEVFVVTETHLNSSVPDTEISIPGMKHLRLDRSNFNIYFNCTYI